MARKPRLFVPDVPYHIVQRGNNKTKIFLSEADYVFFLNVLKESKRKYPCFIYAYCLMDNHFHLLVKPEAKENVSLLMKLLGAKYVRYINKNYNRTGTLWEGRFKCLLIEEESYFLTCLHYIEMNPLRAGIVGLPSAYKWSSYRFRAFGEENDILDLDPWYKSLGHNAQMRQFNYRHLFENQILDQSLQRIREMTNKDGMMGSENFKQQIENILNRKIVFRTPGRPKKQEK